jgi:hypothetical protein
MKAGTDSKGKTIFAVVFMVIAVAVFVYMFFLRGDGGGGSAAPAAQGAAAPGTTPGGAARPAAARARTNRREKPLLGPKVQQSLDPRLNMAMLEQSEKITYAGTGRNIFEMTAEPPAPAIPTPVAEAKIERARVTPQPPPPPPQIPLKFYGWASKPGETKSVFLSSQTGDVFVAKEGEIVDRRYKVVKINPSSVEMEDMLTNYRQQIPLSQQTSG